MGLIEDEFSRPLLSAVKGKSNKTRPIRIGIHRETAVRVARGSPEVVVKISGFTKGSAHLKAHISYISRNGKIDLEDQNGMTYEGATAMKSLREEWDQTIRDSNPSRANRRDAVKMVLSMPPGTDALALKKAVRQFAAREFENHEYVMALHTDEAHPHVHLTVQMRGFNGERLNPRKADLQRWREGFAHCLLNEGVDCVATPRSLRNKSRGHSQARRHADERRRQRGQGRWQEEFHSIRRQIVERSQAEWDAIRERCRKVVQAAWLVAAIDFEAGADRFGRLRPNYKRYERNDEGRRDWQRYAYLYESGARHVGGARAAWSFNGLRNLSSGEVVCHRQPPEGLLQGVSRDRLGRSPEAHHDLRRERDLAGPGGAFADGVKTAEQLGRREDVVATPKEAAVYVRRFLEHLHGPSTRQEKELER